jgi:putative tricarboxylic transport membrane protein
MSDDSKDGPRNGPGQRHVEMGVAAVMALLGIAAVVGSLRVGTGWGIEGPKSGFFPFWIGLIVALTSVYNLSRAYIGGNRRKLFAEWGQIRQVLKVVWPLAVFVAAVPWTGIYLASALLVLGFMRYLGRYGWPLTLAVSIGLPVLVYVTFENWFLVPLPKGPLEDWLGL